MDAERAAASACAAGRALALKLLETALTAIEGRRCVREALRSTPINLSGPVYVLAVGKAAASMTLGAHDALAERGTTFTQALVITKDGHGGEDLPRLPGVTLLESAHPVPDERSLRAGEQALRWVAGLPPEATPLFLVSGGASSLVEVLEPGVSLQDLTRMTNQGLAAGIAIEELNARRRALSRIKGGRLTALLAGRPALALFLSDVPGDDPAVIGSGLLGPSAQATDAVHRRIIASIDIALTAAREKAQQLGFAAHVAQSRFAGEAAELGVRMAQELAVSPVPVCLWGGESTVTLPEHPGRGGRNQHLALAAAGVIAGSERVFLAAGTDGTDGPTEVAGALVDGGTVLRLSRGGIDPAESLRRADAGSALAVSCDLLTTGPTGTNAGDLVIGVSLRGERRTGVL